MFVILSVSDGDKHFASAIAEYAKRLGNTVKFENLKPFKDTNRSLIIQRETKNILQVIEKKYINFQKILLIKEGKELSTEELHMMIRQKDTVCIIGGPYGVEREMIKESFPKIREASFGKITMPHGLAKLVLTEQLYRCSTLDIGKNYHY